MRLTTFLGDGIASEVISVASKEEAIGLLREIFSCELFNEQLNEKTISFFNPQFETNLWTQSYDTDNLGGLVGKLETDWHRDW